MGFYLIPYAQHFDDIHCEASRKCLWLEHQGNAHTSRDNMKLSKMIIERLLWDEQANCKSSAARCITVHYFLPQISQFLLVFICLILLSLFGSQTGLRPSVWSLLSSFITINSLTPTKMVEFSCYLTVYWEKVPFSEDKQMWKIGSESTKTVWF